MISRLVGPKLYLALISHGIIIASGVAALRSVCMPFESPLRYSQTLQTSMSTVLAQGQSEGLTEDQD